MASLVQVIAALTARDEHSTIYAKKPWSCECDAGLLYDPDGDGDVPLTTQIDGIEMDYFLEVATLNEVLEGWLSEFSARPSPQAICGRIIRYAEDDA